MRTVLDEKTIEPQPGSVRDALGAVRDIAEDAGRIIIEAKGDGAPLPDEYLAEPPESDGGYSELTFTSVERGVFLAGTLRDASDAVELALRKQSEATESIQTGDQPRAAESLAELLEIWEAVRSVALQAGRLMDIDPASVQIPGDSDGPAATGAACIGTLKDALEQLRRAVTEGDWTDAGDVLEGELADAGAQWRRLLAAMAAAARDS